MRSDSPLPTGSVIGILGGGQLGMMTVEAATALGYQCHIFAPDGGDAPACDIAADATRADYDDITALKTFAESIDTLTTEFENVPAGVMEEIAKHNPNLKAISPGPGALRVAQHRMSEKTLARSLGIATPAFAAINKAGDMAKAMADMAGGAILKTCRLGYDGKGQVAVAQGDDYASAFASLNSDDCILEKKINFIAEASFLIARTQAGEVMHFPPTINTHRNGILAVSVAPADENILPANLFRAGQEAVAKLAEHLHVIGLLAMETFITDAGIMFNEIAPRPHNSFHWTIEGAETSQFAQLVLAITGNPLGATDIKPGKWRMENILGDDADMQKLAAAKAANAPGTFIHDYNKTTARPGRKMGHITFNQ